MIALLVLLILLIFSKKKELLKMTMILQTDFAHFAKPLVLLAQLTLPSFKFISYLFLSCTTCDPLSELYL